MDTLFVATQVVCYGVGIVSASLNIPLSCTGASSGVACTRSAGSDCLEQRKGELETDMSARQQKLSAKDKILDAALMVIRAKGYTATTVDDLCAAGDVTKGAFFHHFKSKDDLAIAAADHWSEMTSELCSGALSHSSRSTRPRARLHRLPQNNSDRHGR